MSISIFVFHYGTSNGNGGFLGFLLFGFWFGIGIGNGLGFIFLGFEVLIPEFGYLVLDLIVIPDFFICRWDLTRVRDCGPIIFKFVVKVDVSKFGYDV